MSLTPPVIQRQPVGLLDFFGLKNGGQYPQTLAAVLAPIIDVHRLYELDIEEFISDGVSVACGTVLGPFDFGAAGNRPGIVPQNELWHVHEYSYQVAIPANCYASFIPAIQVQRRSPISPGVGRGTLVLGPAVSTPRDILTATAHVLKIQASNFWMPPDSILSGETIYLDPLATVLNAQHNVRFTRYRRA